MGILGNFTRAQQFGVRNNGGGAVALARGALSTSAPAQWRNHIARDGSSTALRKTAKPHGYYPAGAWRMALEAGAMVATGTALLEIDAGAAEIAAGRGLAGADTWLIDLSEAPAGLVATGSGADTWAIDAAGAIGGVVTGVVDDSFSIDLSAPTPGGLAWGVGAASFGVDAAGDLMGIGWMVADESPAQLTAEAVAQAVGARIVEAGFTADQIMRLLAAHAAGAATGLESGNPQFVGLDGSTVRIDGAYSGGTRTIDSLNGE